MRVIFDGDVQTLPELIAAISEDRSQFKEVDRCVFIAETTTPDRAVIEIEALPGLLPASLLGVNPFLRAEEQRESGRLIMPVLGVIKNGHPIQDAKGIVLFSEPAIFNVLDSNNKGLYTSSPVDVVRVDSGGELLVR